MLAHLPGYHQPVCSRQSQISRQGRGQNSEFALTSGIRQIEREFCRYEIFYIMLHPPGFESENVKEPRVGISLLFPKSGCILWDLEDMGSIRQYMISYLIQVFDRLEDDLLRPSTVLMGKCNPMAPRQSRVTMRMTRNERSE